jgi:hypothetical protein
LHVFAGEAARIMSDSYPEWMGYCDTSHPLEPDGHFECAFTQTPPGDCDEVDSSVLPAFEGRPLKVVITELMVAPEHAPGEAGQWIELMNVTGWPLDLAGFRIGVSTEWSAALELNSGGAPLVVPGPGALVLCGSADPATNGGVVCGFEYGSASLPMGEEGTLFLWDQAGQLIDQVSWTQEVVDPGYSLSLSHPFADNTWASGGAGTHWFSQTPNRTYRYNDADYGSPGALNLDVVDVTFLWGQPPPGDPCKLVFCQVLNYFAHHIIQGCCSSDPDCVEWYPDYLDQEVDFDADGDIDDADRGGVRAAFDEIMVKPCLAHRCRANSDPAAPGGCVMAGYPVAEVGCDDHNPCTLDHCACTVSDPALCLNNDASDGYQRCDYDSPVVPGDRCCYNDIHAQTACDDGDPSTLNQCQEFKDGAPWFRCYNPPRPCYCGPGLSPCQDYKVCTTDTCEDNCVCHSVPRPDCCNTSPECEDPFNYTIDLCCAGEAQAIPSAPNLNYLCSGSGGTPENPRCVHKTGEGFCETAGDCVDFKPESKACLTSYCILHKCRFGEPLVFEGCCVPGADECDDGDPCTLDQCQPDRDGRGTCSHVPDPAKPGCCSSPGSCIDPDPTDCIAYPCVFNGAYSQCTESDLVALGRCCLANSNCDDGDDCTHDFCLARRCRHEPRYAGCCTTAWDCPFPQDECVLRTCGGLPLPTCGLEAKPGCTANLPYLQGFDFPGHPYYEGYADVSVLGWGVEELSGAESGNWALSGAESTLGADRHLRFDAPVDLANFDSCADLPRINTLGQNHAVIAWRNGLEVAPDQLAPLELRVDGRKSPGQWTGVWKRSDITGDQPASSYQVDLPTAVLYSTATELRFCIASASLKAGGYWAIDDVKVVRGHAPTLLNVLVDLEVEAGANRTLIDKLEAVDSDYDHVGFNLVDAPGWLVLVDIDANYTSPDKHSTARLVARPAVCSALGEPYEVKLRVSDPWLDTYATFKLLVTGCTR